MNHQHLFVPPEWQMPPLLPLHLPQLYENNCRAAVLRLDQAHPVISGNKWFKLHYWLEAAQQTGANRVVTFGGAWSNHLVATACACAWAGIAATGIVRGMEAGGTATLQQCAAYGMELVPASRSAYRTLQQSIHDMPEYAGACIIPEGGAGANGCRGAATIATLHDLSGFSHLLCAVGTGATMAGLISAAQPHQTVTGVNVLKGGTFQATDINGMTGRNHLQPHRLLTDFHFGGYAKSSPALFEFMNGWYRETGIATDWVYTAKLFYAFTQLLQQHFFTPGSNVLIVHSGGLQGNASLPKGLLIF